jgi:preprotein translocase subunit YajC
MRGIFHFVFFIFVFFGFYFLLWGRLQGQKAEMKERADEWDCSE